MEKLALEPHISACKVKGGPYADMSSLIGARETFDGTGLSSGPQSELTYAVHIKHECSWVMSCHC